MKNGDENPSGRWARLDQRDFDIKPCSAMMGTLKIRPHVDLEVRLPR